MAVAGLILAVGAKICSLTGTWNSIYAVSTVISNEIWFVLGMSICIFDVKTEDKKQQGVLSGVLFIALSVAVYMTDFYSTLVTFAMGGLGCVAVLLLVGGFKEKRFRKVMDFLAKYTMPIFLMHTLFAAPMRTVLLKTGIENAEIHVVLGLGISFIGPIIAAWIMKKTKWLEFFLYPNRVCK